MNVENRIRIHPWSLRFSHGNLETRFYRGYFVDSLQILRIVLVLGLLTQGVELFGTRLGLPGARDMAGMAPYRVFIFLPFIGIALGGSLMFRFRTVLPWFLEAGTVLVAGAYIWSARVHPPRVLIYHTVEFALFILSYLLFFRVPFRHNLALAPILVLVYAVSLFGRADVALPARVEATGSFVLVAAFGMLADYMLELYARRDFLRVRLLEQRRRRLAKLAANLREQSIRDALTGVYNRHYMMLRLKEALAHQRRYHQPSCIILLDLDNFKEFNDQFGHLVGDKLLQRIAEDLVRQVRRTDLVFRFGGDEFLILLLNTKLEEATQLARRLTRNIRGVYVDPSPHFLAVGCSAGVTALGAKDDGVEKVLRRVDRALYRAKWSGKRRVEWEA